MIHVTIVSPNPALRIGLRELLGRQDGIKVVGEAVDLEDMNEIETGVVVLASVSSARLPGRKINCAILFLTNDVESIRSMLTSDTPAWGVLPLDATEEELAAAVHAVGEGLWVGAPGLVGAMIRFPGRRELLGEESLPEPVTARELEVIQLMAQGLANKQIALSLGISEHTVKFHLSSLYAKLGVASRTEAIKRGIELGLISL